MSGHPNLKISVEKDESGDFEYAVVRVPVNDATEELTVWWLMTAAKDLWAQTPKMHEYGGGGEGSADLRDIGTSLAELTGWEQPDAAVVQEMGVWFYAKGKIARLISDYKQRRAGKDDTWHDLTVYSMMARRIKDVGRWP